MDLGLNGQRALVGGGSAGLGGGIATVRRRRGTVAIVGGRDWTLGGERESRSHRGRWVAEGRVRRSPQVHPTAVSTSSSSTRLDRCSRVGGAGSVPTRQPRTRPRAGGVNRSRTSPLRINAAGHRAASPADRDALPGPDQCLRRGPDRRRGPPPHGGPHPPRSLRCDRRDGSCGGLPALAGGVVVTGAIVPVDGGMVRALP